MKTIAVVAIALAEYNLQMTVIPRGLNGWAVLLKSDTGDSVSVAHVSLSEAIEKAFSRWEKEML